VWARVVVFVTNGDIARIETLLAYAMERTSRLIKLTDPAHLDHLLCRHDADDASGPAPARRMVIGGEAHLVGRQLSPWRAFGNHMRDGERVRGRPRPWSAVAIKYEARVDERLSGCNPDRPPHREHEPLRAAMRMELPRRSGVIGRACTSAASASHEATSAIRGLTAARFLPCTCLA